MCDKRVTGRVYSRSRVHVPADVVFSHDHSDAGLLAGFNLHHATSISYSESSRGEGEAKARSKNA